MVCRMVVPADIRDIIRQSTFKVPTGHTYEHPAAIAGAPPPGISRCGSSRWACIGTPGLVASGHPWGSGIDTPSHDASQRSRPRVVAISRTRACRDCSVASAAGELASAKGSAMGPRLRIVHFSEGILKGQNRQKSQHVQGRCSAAEVVMRDRGPHSELTLTVRTGDPHIRAQREQGDCHVAGISGGNHCRPAPRSCGWRLRSPAMIWPGVP